MLATQASLGRPVRVAAVGDLHCTVANSTELAESLEHVHENADVLLLCGDLTDYGLAEEAHALARALSSVRVPVLAVLGNHDHESSDPEGVARILFEHAHVRVLRGDSIELFGIGFAGAKGFGGGFGSGTLGHWGEAITKRFVDEAIEEALKLETSLARLRTERRVVLLHYSPVRSTVEGEPLEIFPFLGCSRLEEPLLRYPVDVVFHGHAHRGRLEGSTKAGAPVYNVAMPLLRRSFPDALPFRVFEVG